MKRFLIVVFAAVLVMLNVSVVSSAGEYESHRFERIELTDVYYSEGVNIDARTFRSEIAKSRWITRILRSAWPPARAAESSSAWTGT